MNQSGDWDQTGPHGRDEWHQGVSPCMDANSVRMEPSRHAGLTGSELVVEGLCFDVADGRLRNAEQPQLTFSGVAIYRPEFFANCEAGRFSVAPMLRAAADANLLAASEYSGSWVDVGTIKRLEALNGN